MVKLEVELTKEQIEACFENAEIKMSAKKFKAILENIENSDVDIIEVLEEAFMEFVEQMIYEEFGE